MGEALSFLGLKEEILLFRNTYSIRRCCPHRRHQNEFSSSKIHEDLSKKHSRIRLYYMLILQILHFHFTTTTFFCQILAGYGFVHK